MKTLGYYNGNYGPLEEMTVPMNDRACFFGDGVYRGDSCKKRKDLRFKGAPGPLLQQRRTSSSKFPTHGKS